VHAQKKTGVTETQAENFFLFGLDQQNPRMPCADFVTGMPLA